AYIVRRLLLMVPTLILVTIIIFSAIRMIPGNVIDLMVADMASESGMGPELTAAWLRHELGMDVPVYQQYASWVGIWPNKDGIISGLVQGNLGESLWTGRTVVEEVFTRLPVSIELGLIAITTAIIWAIPIGTYSAIRQDTGGDYVGRTIAILAISLPNFWVGTLVIVYPSIWWGWSPSIEYIPLVSDLRGNLTQFILPGIIMGLVMSGTAMRMTRTMMLEVLRQDYIRTAWAKGLTERTIIMRHALKNALIPVITQIGLLTPTVIAGSVVMEQIFCLPGVGRLLIQALNTRDYPIISGINLVLAIFVLLINLVVDLAYGWFDPRVTYK
ncbi:ABC transporter permease, partial [Chloroflexota bacterium]